MAIHILNKIRILFIREKAVFSLIVICTFITSIILCFSFGLFCNFIEKKNEQVYELTMLEIGFDSMVDEGKYITKKQIEDCVAHFSKNVTDDVEMIFVRVKLENGVYLECRFTIKDGNYFLCENVRDNLIKSDDLINYFTESDEMYGNKVAIIPGEEWDWNDLSVLEGMLIDDDHILIQGESYKIIGYHGWGSRILLPFDALKDDSVMDSLGMSLAFDKSISLNQYNEVKRVVEQYLGDCAHVPEMPVLAHFQRMLYNTVLLVVILITVLAAVNFSILYHFILLQRRKDLGIFLVCGLNKNRASVYVTISCYMYLIPSFVLGILIYHYMILPCVSWMIPYAGGHYNILTYFLLTVIFCVVSILIIGVTITTFIHRVDLVRIMQADSL